MHNGKLLLLSGNANRPLAEGIAKTLNTDLIKATVDTFSDGETRVKIEADVRGADVFVIQPISPPANQNLMELFIILDALRRASTDRITAVMPYFGYARQDRKDQPRVPITAKLVANLITAAGANRVLTLDLHAHQIQGFFDIQLDHLYAVNVFLDHLKEQNIENPVIVSPDVGGVKMARGFASRIEADLAVIDKRRISDKNTEVMNVLGDVEGKTALIVDDICASAGTLVEAAIAVKERGAKEVYAAISHGILSDPAVERIDQSNLKEVWVTDSIPLPPEKNHPKIKVLSVAPLMAEAIKRIHSAESISKLFVS
jgi:ribose-phosphate pyrophosphokinase